jgi:hypothetical protein
VSWPDLPASVYAGECWAIEAELTPKPLARTVAIMSGLLTRTAGHQPAARPGPGPRYHRVVYLTSPAARQRLRQIDTAENAHAREIEALTHDTTPADSRAVTALRSRILARFTELENERTTIDTQLAELATAAPATAYPELLDALPMLGDILENAPTRLWQQLLAALDIQALYNKNLHQVTVHATITDTTAQAVAAITADADDHPTSTRPAQDPSQFFASGASPCSAPQLPRSWRHPLLAAGLRSRRTRR